MYNEQGQAFYYRGTTIMRYVVDHKVKGIISLIYPRNLKGSAVKMCKNGWIEASNMDLEI